MNALTQPAALAASLNINLTDFIDEFGTSSWSRSIAPPGLYRLRQRSPPVGDGSTQAQALRGPGRGRPGHHRPAAGPSSRPDHQRRDGHRENHDGHRCRSGHARPAIAGPWSSLRRTWSTSGAARSWRPSQPPASGYSMAQILSQAAQAARSDGRRLRRRQEFFILGRVRMRMGFHWRLACWKKRAAGGQLLAACPDCGQVLEDLEGNLVTVEEFERGDRRRTCSSCRGALWTLIRPGKPNGGNRRATILTSMCRIPTIGPVRAERLLNDFGEDFLATMLVDNVSEFINLMDAKGNFVFSDRQAKRMERSMANIEFGFGEGGYQPTEFIKRYLPDGYFDLLVVDEGHEYKNSGSAQGQAMGVLAAKARKTVLLTGTLMGGYADDLFYLLFRILTSA